MGERIGQRWLVPGEGQTVLESFPVPEPGSGQLLVETETSLVSAGTELAIYTGIHQGLTNPNVSWPKYPQAMGYMAVVRVVRAGPGVTGFASGDRLLTSTGHTSHALLEAAADGGGRFWRLPDGPASHLVLARMARTAAAALCQAQVTFAQSAVVVGLGIIGQVTLRLFAAVGAWPLVGVDPVPLRRAAALRGGAVGAVDPAAGDPQAQLQTWLPAGADIVVDATGWAAALPGAMRLARDAGKVVVLGSPRGTAPDVDFYRDLHRRSLELIGAHDSGVGPVIREGFPWTTQRVVPAVVEWVRSGKLPVADLITHCVPPTELPQMYSGLLHEKDLFLGVVLDWRQA